MRRWSELEPWERRAELAKVHPELNEDCLLAAGETVPELRAQLEAQRSKDDRLKVVLRYFGDQGHPGPTEPFVRRGGSVNGVGPVWECPTGWRLPALDNGAEPVPHPERPQRGDGRAPGWIPLRLVEDAANLYASEKLGRRKIAERLPGLTEYQAGQILGWYRIGRPAGLWLEGGRLKWGSAISTTSDGVRLPRL